MSQTTATTRQTSSFDPKLNWVVSYPKSGNTWIRLVARCYSTGRPELSALGRAGDMAVAPHHNASPIPLHQLGLAGEAQVRYAAMLDLAGQMHSWQDAQEDVDVYITRYEDLHDNPYPEFRRILEHVLGEVEQDRLEAAVDACAFDRLQSLEEAEDVADFPEASEQADEGFFRSGQTDGWKDELPCDLAEKIEEDHGEMMEQFGYL